MMLFILIACTCIYSVSTETVEIIQQPKTDKKCYEKGDNASLALSFHVTGTTRLDSYIVALTENPKGIGGFKCKGTELNFYDTNDRDINHARYRVTMSHINRTVEYRMDVTSLEYHDETSTLYAFIFESHSNKVMIKSSVGAEFHVKTTCPQRQQTNKPSMVTTAPSDDSTSKVNILAEPTISVADTIYYYLRMLVILVFLGGLFYSIRELYNLLM